ncbi:MAG TPA: NAD(P)/FAD-dependent oxidoreductase, partial [Thermoanaerobaculia bacterium]|nr:NAD(P)/FAD-dependent oxidoreductase [Thermoanaerobaculia bacterium]
AEIQKRLRAQARDMGAELARGNVVSAAGSAGDFLLTGADGKQWRARTLLLATGVARYHPTVDGDVTPCLAYAGKGTMFYCPDCEAPEVVGKDTLVIAVGTADAGAGLALGLMRYTRRLRLLLTGDTALSGVRADQLAAAGIPVIAGAIRRLLGDKRNLHGLELESGETLAAEAFFVSSPSPGRTDLARQLGVEMSPGGDHAVPRSQRGDTNVPGVWIAGDLRPLTQQVAIAMGTGSIAAVMIDQQLRRQEVAAARPAPAGVLPSAAG